MYSLHKDNLESKCIDYKKRMDYNQITVKKHKKAKGALKKKRNKWRNREEG